LGLCPIPRWRSSQRSPEPLAGFWREEKMEGKEGKEKEEGRGEGE